MTRRPADPTLIRDPQLAPHVAGATAAWLWGSNGPIWANAAAAAASGLADPAALLARAHAHPVTAQVQRLAAGLARGGAPRLERLRGLVGGFGRALVCACRKITLADGTVAVLITAAEGTGPVLSLAQRVQRLFAGEVTPLAAFGLEGRLLHAGPGFACDAAAVASTRGGTPLASLPAGARVDGQVAGQPVTLERIGTAEDGFVLAVPAPAAVTQPPDAAPAETVPVAGPVAPPTQTEPLAAEPVETEPEAAETDETAAAAEAADTERAAAEETVSAADASGADDSIAESTDVAAEERAGDAAAPDAVAADDAEEDAVAAAEPEAVPQPVAGKAPEPVPLPPTDRRHPLRFVWQIDAAGLFTLGTPEFIAVMGPSTAAMLGRPWAEIADALGLDREQRLIRALASRDTFSGIVVAWPVDGTEERLTVELSGLPMFDRDRNFRGYRGFGVCRDVERLAAIGALRHAEAGVSRSEPRAAPAEENDKPDAPAAEVVSESEPESGPGDDEPTATAEPRPHLTVVPQVRNVLPFRPASGSERRGLTPVERNAFREIARALGARIEDEEAPGPSAETPDETAAAAPEAVPPAPERDDDEGHEAREAAPMPDAADEVPAIDLVPSAFAARPAHDTARERALLALMPSAVLVLRGDRLLYANPATLDLCGYDTLEALEAAGGLARLFGSRGVDVIEGPGGSFDLVSGTGETIPVDVRPSAIAWDGDAARLVTLTPGGDEEKAKAQELALRAAEAKQRELASILDTATDGVIVVDRQGRMVAANRSAEALFGYEQHEFVDRPLIELFAPESHRDALDYLDGLTRNGVASLLNDGREVIGRVRQGGLIPLFMTMGRIAEDPEKFCAVFRDITQWKRAEEELTEAKRQAERASSAKSDFLAKISHEIRTPLNAIIGFSEVMMDERFGPVGNERYREYLKDIHTSGQHLVSLINDLLDLSKIEAGKLDLAFTSVNLNELMQQCVALMQPQANRERIIIRTSLSPTLPPVVADARSVRQIVLNLLSNSIKFTGAGGQVIVSTALTERGEAVLRVRDTGVGMTEKDIQTALEPFRQLATSAKWGSGGTGLGLPLTKALAEANRASFAIKSAVNSGTLVEVTFPATRVLAE